MLSLFPHLLDWNWYAPFLFRLFLGYYYLSLGFNLFNSGKTSWMKVIGVVSCAIGVSFVLGSGIQALGLSSGLIALIFACSKSIRQKISPESSLFFTLLTIVSFSLLLLGAGPYATDLPL